MFSWHYGTVFDFHEKKTNFFKKGLHLHCSLILNWGFSGSEIACSSQVTDYVPQSVLCYQNVLGYHMCAVQ